MSNSNDARDLCTFTKRQRRTPSRFGEPITDEEVLQAVISKPSKSNTLYAVDDVLDLRINDDGTKEAFVSWKDSQLFWLKPQVRAGTETLRALMSQNATPNKLNQLIDESSVHACNMQAMER